MKRVRARKDSIVGASSKAVEASLRDTKNLTVIQGHARFASAREVSVGDAVLSADCISSMSVIVRQCHLSRDWTGSSI